MWQKAAGYLDASIRYRVTNSIELSVEGSNLLNTQTKLLQQVADADTDLNADGTPTASVILTPNAYFQNDRRFIVGVRWKMASDGRAAAAAAAAAAASAARTGDADLRRRLGDPGDGSLPGAAAATTACAASRHERRTRPLIESLRAAWAVGNRTPARRGAASAKRHPFSGRRWREARGLLELAHWHSAHGTDSG